jgi:hypothetical protein
MSNTQNHFEPADAKVSITLQPVHTSKTDLRINDKEIKPSAQSALPVLPVTLTFKDVRYFVPLVNKEKEAVTKDPNARLELLKVGTCQEVLL